MKQNLFILPIAAIAALGFSSCQHKPKDTANMPALEDYPFDPQGNYIESKAQKLKPSATKPVIATNIQKSSPSVPSAPVESNYSEVKPSAPPPPPVVAENTGKGHAKEHAESPPKPKETVEKTKGTAKSAKASRSYIVAKGDTLSAIASHNGTTVAAIRSANDLDSANMIRVGQKLKLPGTGKVVGGGSGAATKAPVKKTEGKASKSDKPVAQKPAHSGTSSSSGGSVTVKSGDSLWSIAHKNHVSVDALKKANNLSSDALHPGQTLKLP